MEIRIKTIFLMAAKLANINTSYLFKKRNPKSLQRSQKKKELTVYDFLLKFSPTLLDHSQGYFRTYIKIHFSTSLFLLFP